MRPFSQITFKVIIMNAQYSQRYHQYESQAIRVKNYLDKYFSKIKINTPIQSNQIIQISKR